MNAKQRVILIIVAVIIALMLVYPPFRHQGRNYEYYNEGFHWLFSKMPDGSIDSSKILIEWLGVLIIGGVLFLAAKDQNKQ